MRMRVNAENIEKVKGSAEKRPVMGGYVTTNHIRSHHGITNHILLVENNSRLNGTLKNICQKST